MLVMLLSFYAKFTVFWLECMTFQLAFKTTLFSGRRDRKEGSCYYSSRAFWAENFGQMSSTKVSILSLNYTQ